MAGTDPPDRLMQTFQTQLMLHDPGYLGCPHCRHDFCRMNLTRVLAGFADTAHVMQT